MLVGTLCRENTLNHLFIQRSCINFVMFLNTYYNFETFYMYQDIRLLFYQN